MGAMDGTEFEPFGTDAGFARDCVACHSCRVFNDQPESVDNPEFRRRPYCDVGRGSAELERNYLGC